MSHCKTDHIILGSDLAEIRVQANRQDDTPAELQQQKEKQA